MSGFYIDSGEIAPRLIAGTGPLVIDDPRAVALWLSYPGFTSDPLPEVALWLCGHLRHAYGFDTRVDPSGSSVVLVDRSRDDDVRTDGWRRLWEALARGCTGPVIWVFTDDLRDGRWGGYIWGEGISDGAWWPASERTLERLTQPLGQRGSMSPWHRALADRARLREQWLAAAANADDIARHAQYAVSGAMERYLGTTVTLEGPEVAA